MRRLRTILCLQVLALAGITQAQTALTTLTLENKTASALKDYPLTFGLPFAQGALNKSSETVVLRVAGVTLTTQVDMKTSWTADGSLKFGIVSAIIPALASREKITLEVVKAAAASNAAGKGFLDPAGFKAQGYDGRIVLEGMTGTGVPASLEARLSSCAEGDLKPWLRGSVVTEYICTKRIHDKLAAEWEVRVYPGATWKARVSHTLENGFLQHLGTINYNARIEQGKGALAQVYAKTGVVHNYAGRWRRVFWVGEAAPETELKFSLDYLVGTNLIPPYARGLKVAESRHASDWTRYQAAPRDIMDNGTILKYFPTTGGREEIGLLPAWTARYLVTMDNRQKAIMLGNAELAGSCPTHFKESDATKPSAGRVVNLDDRPELNFYAIGNTSATAGGFVFTGEKNGNGWTIDKSHQGSFAYVPYLVTGDYWFLQEMFYWASFNLASNSYSRQGAKAIIVDQYRGHAWGLRTVGHAASLAPDDSPDKAYFNAKVKNNIDYDADWNIGPKAHGLHIFMGQDADPTSRAGFSRIFAPWQHDFNVLVYSDLARHGFAKAAEVRDSIGLFTIGRFTNDPAFPRFGAAGYWWPLLRLDKSIHKPGDWLGFWTDVALYEGRVAGVVPLSTELLKEDYANSYPYIARAALSFLTHLPKGQDGYNFLNTFFPDVKGKLNENPAFGFSRGGDDPLNTVGVLNPSGPGKALSGSKVAVFPTEFNPKWHGELRMRNIPANTHLFIITPKGEVVFDKDIGKDQSVFLWNGRGNSGQVLGPERYHFYFRDAKRRTLDSGSFLLVR